MNRIVTQPEVSLRRKQAFSRHRTKPFYAAMLAAEFLTFC